MELKDFLKKLNETPAKIKFTETIATINANYNFTETQFKNGKTINEAGQNSGSCKIFSFAKLNKLNQNQTLQCFGDYYRKDVLKNPLKNDHANIRNFIKYGWTQISFENEALTIK